MSKEAPSKSKNSSTRRKKSTYDKPVSLCPLPFDEALAASHGSQARDAQEKARNETARLQ